MNRQQQIEAFIFNAHKLGFERLFSDSNALNRVKEKLHEWRSREGQTSTDPLWDEWEQLLNGSLQKMRDTLLADSDHAAHLRSVSPMGILITAQERMKLLGESRALV